jgi:hypothetical protein
MTCAENVWKWVCGGVESFAGEIVNTYKMFTMGLDASPTRGTQSQNQVIAPVIKRAFARWNIRAGDLMERLENLKWCGFFRSAQKR